MGVGARADESGFLCSSAVSAPACHLLFWLNGRVKNGFAQTR